MRKIKKTLMKRHHQGMIYLKTILLKVVLTTCGPVTIFKQQSLLFHVVSKTFLAQNYLVFIHSNILYFLSLSLLSCTSCMFSTQPRNNQNKQSFEKNTLGEKFLMTFANALTWSRSYWKYSILNITPCKRFRINE